MHIQGGPIKNVKTNRSEVCRDSMDFNEIFAQRWFVLTICVPKSTDFFDASEEIQDDLFWEKEFDILQPKKNKKGNRLFTPRDVDNLKLIYFLVKDKGYTLAGAKDILKNNANLAREQHEIVESLYSIREFLVDLKGQME